MITRGESFCEVSNCSAYSQRRAALSRIAPLNMEWYNALCDVKVPSAATHRRVYGVIQGSNMHLDRLAAAEAK